MDVVEPRSGRRSALDYLIGNHKGYGCRIVVVDYGRDEKYQQVFEKISDINIILSHLENCGKGAKIKIALTYLKKDLWDGNVIGDGIRCSAFIRGYNEALA